jgi:uncharacterized protein (DUF1778 family)
MADALEKTTAAAKRPRPQRSARRAPADRDRLNCRIDTRIKQRAEDAASLLGQNLSTFTESALNEKASQVLEREEAIMLSDRDFTRFLAAIEDPKPVGARLKAAAEEYKTISRQHPELNW